MRLLVVGGQFGRCGQVADRFQRAASVGVKLSQLEMRGSLRRIQAEQFLVGGLGLVELAGVDVGQSELSSRLHVRRICFHRTVEEEAAAANSPAWTAIKPCRTRAALPVGM